MNTANVEAVGKKMGTYVKMDSSGSVGIEKSIRIRVLVSGCPETTAAKGESKDERWH